MKFKNFNTFFLLVLTVFFVAALFFINKNPRGEVNMKISTTAFEQGQKIPDKYTCDGENISPAFTISEVPAGTKTLALILDDPDSPSGEFVHWVVWNINAENTELPENFTDGVQGLNSYGKNGYAGPCPPPGTHHYFFRFYALDTELSLPTSAQKTDLVNAMNGHILAEAQYGGTFR